jgi:hypothetical protein
MRDRRSWLCMIPGSTPDRFCKTIMASNDTLKLILQELKRVQERAEKLRAHEPGAVDDAPAARAMCEHIEAAVQKIRKMISEYEDLQRDKSA